MKNFRHTLPRNIKSNFFVILSGILVLIYWKLLPNFNVDLTSPIPVKVKNKVCLVNYNDSRRYVQNNESLPVIYFVTPTYPRPAQVPELVRLSHTLMHVPRLHWIVADDNPDCTEVLQDVLRRSNLPFTHISSPKPFRVKKNMIYARGVSNRLAAVDWLKGSAKEGVLYFGDDDNTVDLRLFDEIRFTKKVSMFPVGLIGTFLVSSPLIKDGKVVGFIDSWLGNRQFPVDMAGFAVNLRFLKPNTRMPFKVGYEEDTFLGSLDLTFDEIEPKADNCSKVIVWHTKTQPTMHREIEIDPDGFAQSDNLASLLQELKYQDHSMPNNNAQHMTIRPLVKQKNNLHYYYS